MCRAWLKSCSVSYQQLPKRDVLLWQGIIILALLNQSIHLVTVRSNVSIPTEQVWAWYRLFICMFLSWYLHPIKCSCFGLWFIYRTLFPYILTPCLIFYTYFEVKNPKFEPFQRPQKFLGASETGNNHNSTIFGAKNKISMNFL